MEISGVLFLLLLGFGLGVLLADSLRKRRWCESVIVGMLLLTALLGYAFFEAWAITGGNEYVVPTSTTPDGRCEIVWSEYLVGMMKSLPVVALCVMVVLLMAHLGVEAEKKHVDKLIRVIVLCGIGFLMICAVSAVCYTPFDGKFHPVPVAAMAPFVLFGYVQCYRYKKRREGLREGSPKVNFLWFIAGITVFLLLMGLYNVPQAYGIFRMAVLSGYIVSWTYILWFSQADTGMTSGRKGIAGSLDELLETAIVVAMLFFCWQVLNA